MDAIFVADFPGLSLENYLPTELVNISLTVISGEVIIQQQGKRNKTLITGQSSDLGHTHTIHSQGGRPSC